MGDCPYPECSAGAILTDIKEANREHRIEIREQLASMTVAVNDMTRMMQEGVKLNAVSEQAIVYLREAEAKNIKDHDEIFERLRTVEAAAISKKDIAMLFGAVAAMVATIEIVFRWLAG